MICPGGPQQQPTVSRNEARNPRCRSSSNQLLVGPPWGPLGSRRKSLFLHGWYQAAAGGSQGRRWWLRCFRGGSWVLCLDLSAGERPPWGRLGRFCQVQQDVGLTKKGLHSMPEGILSCAGPPQENSSVGVPEYCAPCKRATPRYRRPSACGFSCFLSALACNASLPLHAWLLRQLPLSRLSTVLCSIVPLSL